MDTNGVLQVTRTVNGTNETVTVNHDAAGAIAGVKEPNSDSGYPGTTFIFDDRGRVIAQVDASGKTNTIAYDSSDRPVNQTDALGNSTSVRLNDANQP